MATIQLFFQSGRAKDLSASPYKTTDHIIPLYFLIFKVSTSMTEEKNSRLNDSNAPQHNNSDSLLPTPKLDILPHFQRVYYRPIFCNFVLHSADDNEDTEKLMWHWSERKANMNKQTRNKIWDTHHTPNESRVKQNQATDHVFHVTAKQISTEAGRPQFSWICYSWESKCSAVTFTHDARLGRVRNSQEHNTKSKCDS